MQGLSSDLEEILVSKFMAGASGFHALVEIEGSPDTVVSDYVAPHGAFASSRDLLGGWWASPELYYPSTIPPSFSGEPAQPLHPYTYASSFSGGWVYPFYGDLMTNANSDACWPGNCRFGLDDSVTLTPASWDGRFTWDLGTAKYVTYWRLMGCIAGTNPGCWTTWTIEYSDNGTTWTVADTQAASGGVLFGYVTAGPHRYWSVHIAAGTSYGAMFASATSIEIWGGYIAPVPIQVKRISIDKSLQTDADALELECELAPEDEALWSQWLPLVVPDKKIWVHQWYGDNANAVQTFYGFIDKGDETRDRSQRSIVITCRDFMKKAIVQSAIVNYPQGATTAGAVRDPSNFVFLNMQVSDIVNDLLSHMDFPSTAVTTTDYVAGDFEVTDGTSFAAALAQLGALVGYHSFTDEQGCYHFEPIAIGSSSWPYTSGVDLISLERAVDEYELATRVKVVGKDATGADVVQIAIAGAGVVGIPEPTSPTGALEASLNNPIRRVIVNESAITTTTQAAATATAQLAKQDGFRHVYDFGIVGNPGLQKGDTIEAIDPVMGESSLWIVDTYRTEMTVVPGGAGTYVGAVGGTLVD